MRWLQSAVGSVAVRTVGRGAGTFAWTCKGALPARAATSRSTLSDTSLSAARFYSRPSRAGGGGIRSRGDEASPVVTNIAKGEKLKNKDLWTMQDRKALYIKQDGSKEELTLQQVLNVAREQGLDPVLVSGLNGGDLVLKLMDVGRTRHDMQKKKRESAKKNQGGQQSLKELRFGLHIDSGDLATKMKQAKGFLEKGHRVRIFMQLKGADFHRNQALALKRLDEIAQLIGDAGTQDSKPALSGNHVSTTLVPKPQKNTSHRDSRREE